MKKLTYLKRFTLAFIFATVGVISWGQAVLSGTGTQNDPYLISTVSEWNAFAEAVNGGYSYSGEFLKLTQNISGVTKMVGVWNATEADRKPFSGTFYGDGKTITVNYTNSTSGNYTAPFVCTNGATVNRLKVAGNITITNNVGKAAGLIGVNYGSKTKVNGDGTNISVNITNGSNGSAGNYCAGVAVDGRYVEISSCAFSGKIIAGDNSAGFCAIGDENTKLNNSLFVPADGSSITGTKVENFVANGTYNTQYSNKFYYCHDGTVVASTQGTRVYTLAASVTEGFYKKTKLYDNKYYFVPGTGAITNLASYYYLNNLKSEETLGYAVTFDGATVDPGNYTETITNNATSATTAIADIVVGNYTLTVTGDNISYAGSITAAFEVKADLFNGDGIEESPYEIANTTNWNDLADAVNDGYSFAGDYFVLKANISVNVDTGDKMVGAEGNPFSGIFNGDSKTLTFIYTTDTPSYVAPFRYTEGATIRNLEVGGVIFTSVGFEAGLIGVNTRTSSNTTVENVIVSVNIEVDEELWDEEGGGFAVIGKGVSFTDCVYNGFIYAMNYNGGFCGQGDTYTTLNNCLFAPSNCPPTLYDVHYEGCPSYYFGNTFIYSGGVMDNIIDCYYTLEPTDPEEPFQGILAYDEVVDNDVTYKITYTSDNYNKVLYKHIDVELDGLQDSYSYTGSDIYDDIHYTVKFDNNPVTQNVEYTATIYHESEPVVEVINMGDYTLTITGKHNESGAGYYGSASRDFYVGIAGDGSAEKPYILKSEIDWNAFANSENHLQFWADGVHVKLGQDIAVSEMVGTSEYPYQGVFDGNEKTLTFNKTATAANTAPFQYTNGATIKNLTVAGSITTSDYNGAAGLIGINTGTTTVEDIMVSVNIDASGKTDCGGFAIDGSGISFEDCIYNGQIVAGTNSGGFCGTGSDATSFNNCLFAPASGSSINGGYLFAGNANVTSCYYTDMAGTTDNQDAQLVYKEIPENKLAHIIIVLSTKVYDSFVDVTINGIEDYYDYTGENINVEPASLFDPSIDPRCYTEHYSKNGLTVHVIKEMGTYVYTLSGVEAEGYSGTVSKEFVVGLSGEGTDDDPFIISSTADWNKMAGIVNGGNTLRGQYIKLTNDIEASVVVSNVGAKFAGIFDGDWHKITFTCGTASAPYNDDGCAPFGYIDGTTIKNLYVDGTIKSKKKYAAGIAGAATGTNYLINCTSSVYIDCSYRSGDASYGGLVGLGGVGATINFENCMFDGKIIDSRGTKLAEKCGGFAGWINTNVSYTNCTMAGEISVKQYTSNFHRNNTATCTINNYTAFYINNYNNDIKPGPKGKQAPAAAPADTISRKYPVDTPTRYVPGVVVKGLSTTYQYLGDDIDISPEVSYYGTKLVNGTDYTISYQYYANSEWVHADAMNVAGDYKIIISGNGAYAGSCVNEATVIEIDATWNGLKNALAAADGEITLTQDYKDASNEGPIIITGNITLNMAGYTIDRGMTAPDETGNGQVFRIASSATVVINGPGIITGGYNKAISDVDGGVNPEGGAHNDGGGIYNMGDLTLNNVTITGNKCIKFIEGSKHYTARGGGVYNGVGSSFTMNGGALQGNEARGGAGGVHGNKSENFSMTNVMISNNTCEDKGGGIRISSVTNKVTITNCEIRSNRLTIKDESNGGGIFLEGGTLEMTNCNVIANRSTKQGGGFYSVSGTTTATNCAFNDNLSYDDYSTGNVNYGGGICLYNASGKYSVFTLDGGSVDANQSRQNGGGIYLYKGATLKLKGDVKIFGNYKTTVGNEHTNNNIYIADNTSTGVIYIDGALGRSYIGVIKNHTGSSDDGLFTSGLGNGSGDSKGNGTLANFVGDEEYYHVLPCGTEAKLGEPTELTSPATPQAIEISSPMVVTGPIYNVTSITFTGDGCLHIEDGGSIETNIVNNDPDRLVIENGGQIITNSEGVEASIRMDVADALALSNENWYLISSDIKEPNIANETNLITANSTGFPTYDLYRFNEQKDELQWENYRNTAYHDGEPDDFVTLEIGRGYLYRNYLDYTIIIGGELNTAASYKYRVSWHENTIGGEVNKIPGFNILGNPYSHNITKGDSDANIINGELLVAHCYILTQDGAWSVRTDGTPIPPMTGFMVKATAEDDVTITNAVPTSSKGRAKEFNNIIFKVSNSEYSDEAIVEFKEGHGLDKISHLNDKVPMLYVKHEGVNYASACVGEAAKAFDLSFKAKTMSLYTLSMKTKGEFGYIHLIDKVTGEDIDMLAVDEYKFVGTTNDIADRFVVNLGPSTPSTDSESFVWQSGGDIVVNGEGELQVFDMAGRMVMKQHVNGVKTMSTSSLQTGVYVFRFVGNEVKTQKIVVR